MIDKSNLYMRYWWMFYKKEELSSHLCNMEARGPNSEHNRYPVTTIVGGQFSLFMVENVGC